MKFALIFCWFFHQFYGYFVESYKIGSVIDSAVRTFSDFIVQLISIAQYSWNLFLDVNVFGVFICVFALICGVLRMSTWRLWHLILFLFIIIWKFIQSRPQNTISFSNGRINHRFMTLMLTFNSFKLLLQVTFFHWTWVLLHLVSPYIFTILY